MCLNPCPGNQERYRIAGTIRGDSYRLEEKIKAGLLKGSDATAYPIKRATAGEFSMTISGEIWVTLDTTSS
jgi:hypothetical protein